MSILHHKVYENSESKYQLFLCHGLFGSLDNLNSLSQRFSNFYQVINLDLRNHGKSFHDSKMSYKLMAEDLIELVKLYPHKQNILLGHSMGGKVAMAAVSHRPDLFSALLVEDVVAVVYPPSHLQILDALLALDLSRVKQRSDADNFLVKAIPETAVRQFLLKSLQRDDTNNFYWQFNLTALKTNYHALIKDPAIGGEYHGPVLFIRGEKSNYVSDNDFISMKRIFPHASLSTIPNAGHWVHSEQADAFFTHCIDFLKDNLDHY